MKQNVKHLLLALFLSSMCAGVCFAADAKPSPEAVCVRKLDKELPTIDDEISKFLWNNFANQPEEEQFAGLTDEGWKQTAKEFELALVEKAKRQKLDFESLKKCFQESSKVQPGLARVPVGAYATVQGKSAIWIIVFKWEAIGNFPAPQKLSHVMVRAYNSKKIQQVGYVTCG